MMCEVTTDHCFFPLGRSRSGEHRDAASNSIMVPHPTLGWVAGVSRGLVELHDGVVIRLHFLVDIYTAAPLDTGNPNIADFGSCPVVTRHNGVQCVRFAINRDLLPQIRTVFPDLASCRSVPQLCNALPPVPSILDPLSSSCLSPLVITDISQHRFDAPVFGFGLGLPNPTAIRRHCAKEAVVCHIVRERAVLGHRYTWIGDKLFLRLRPPNHRDAAFMDWDAQEQTLLTATAMTLTSRWASLNYPYLPSVASRTRETKAESVPDYVQQPHLGQFMERLLSSLVTQEGRQMVVFNGIAGSGKTFSFRQCVDFVLTLDSSLWATHETCSDQQEQRTYVDAALIVLDAFGNIATTDDLVPQEDSTRLFYLMKFLYRLNERNRLKLCGVEFANSFLFSNSLFSRNLEHTFKVLLWLCSEDDTSIQRLLGVEAALTTLGFTKQQMSFITSVLAAVLVLRTPDIQYEEKEPSFQKSVTFPGERESRLQRALSVQDTHPVWIPYNRATSFKKPTSGMLYFAKATRSSARRYREEAEAIEICANLLGIDAETLSASLSSINDVNNDFEGRLLPAPLTAAAQRRTLARRALARYLYQLLVKWLLEKINEALAAKCVPFPGNNDENGRCFHNETLGDDKSLFLGFLDVPGFIRNITPFTSFESVLINSVTDWLQNTLLRPLEIDDAMREVVQEATSPASVVLYDLCDVPELMFGFRSCVGIFPALEPFVACGHEPTSEELVNAIQHVFSNSALDSWDETHPANHSASVSLQEGISRFTVVHLGGKLTYECGHWIDHDIRAPPDATRKLVRSCENEILCDPKLYLSSSLEFQTLRSMVLRLDSHTADVVCNDKTNTVNGFMTSTASELKAVLLALSSDIYSAEVSTLLCLHAPASCGLDGAELARQLRISHAPELYRSLQDGARRSVLTQCFLKRYASLVPNLQQRDLDGVDGFSSQLLGSDQNDAKYAQELIQSLQTRYQRPELNDLVVGQCQVFGQRHAYKTLETLLHQRSGTADNKDSDHHRPTLDPVDTPTSEPSLRHSSLQNSSEEVKSRSVKSSAEMLISVNNTSPPWNEEQMRVIEAAERMASERFVKLDDLEELLREAEDAQVSNLLLHYLRYLYRLEQDQGFPTSFVENTKPIMDQFLRARPHEHTLTLSEQTTVTPLRHSSASMTASQLDLPEEAHETGVVKSNCRSVSFRNILSDPLATRHWESMVTSSDGQRSDDNGSIASEHSSDSYLNPGEILLYNEPKRSKSKLWSRTVSRWFTKHHSPKIQQSSSILSRSATSGSCLITQ